MERAMPEPSPRRRRNLLALAVLAATAIGLYLAAFLRFPMGAGH